MSWSVTTGKVPADQLAVAVDALEIPTSGYVTTGDEATPAPEWGEQLATAKVAAKTLVASGALGDGGFITVTLTGHANSGHVLHDVHQAELITVNVYRSLA